MSGGDPDPREQFQSLSRAARVRIVTAAMVLADLANSYDPSLRLGRQTLLYKALAVFAGKKDCGEAVPDLETFLIAIMNNLCDQLIDDAVKRFAGNIDSSVLFERDLMATDILEDLEEALTCDDPGAKAILSLMREGYSDPAIAAECKLTVNQVEAIKKRIRRHALTHVRKLLYHLDVDR